MPYLIRNEKGEIKGFTRERTSSAIEHVSNDNPNLIAFKNKLKNRERIQTAIADQVRLLAIKQMKSDGKLPLDYPEPEVENLFNEASEIIKVK